MQTKVSINNSKVQETKKSWEHTNDVKGITETWWDYTLEWNTVLEDYNLKRTRLNKKEEMLAYV